MPPRKNNDFSYSIPEITSAIDTEKFWREVMDISSRLVAEIKATMANNDRRVITFTEDANVDYIAIFVDENNDEMMLISTEKTHRLVEQPIEVIIKVATFINKWLKLIN